MDWIMENYQQGHRPQFVGIRNSADEGFALHDFGSVLKEGGGQGLFFSSADGESESGVVVGSEVDLFALDPDACLVDLDVTLASLKSQLKGETLLGALMFSCSGRGPSDRSILGKKMADASGFENAFPGLPLLGFYAGGEIGPEAKPTKAISLRAGKVSFQGFTVVFGVWIVPERVRSRCWDLDDSDESCSKYVKQKLDKT